jgi:hypothetical protein
VRVSQTEVPGTSALALGPVLIAYAGWAAGTVASRRAGPRLTRWHGDPRVTRLRRVVAVVTAGLVRVGLFWAVNSFAWAFGQGRAIQDALDLPTDPEVVLDTKEPLIDLPEGVTEVRLPASSEDQAFRYRYRGLRLLVAAGVKGAVSSLGLTNGEIVTRPVFVSSNRFGWLCKPGGVGLSPAGGLLPVIT